MTEREALKLLVEVFGGGDWHDEIVDSAWADNANNAIAEAKKVLAQPERKPLTDEEIAYATAPALMGGNPTLTGIVRAIEAAHGIKE